MGELLNKIEEFIPEKRLKEMLRRAAAGEWVRAAGRTKREKASLGNFSFHWSTLFFGQPRNAKHDFLYLFLFEILIFQISEKSFRIRFLLFKD